MGKTSGCGNWCRARIGKGVIAAAQETRYDLHYRDDSAVHSLHFALHHAVQRSFTPTVLCIRSAMSLESSALFAVFDLVSTSARAF